MRSAFLAAMLAFASPAVVHGQELPPPSPGTVPPLTQPTLTRTTLAAAPEKNYWLPVLEGPIFYNLAQNLVARTLSDTTTFDSTWDTFKDNLDGPWWYDEDKFTTNQFGHPYQGSVYFTAGRSLGLNFWESFLNAELGSLVWEFACETEPPSTNDQITTPTAGSLLGEVLFRLAYRIVDVKGGAGFWREAGAFVVSPATGANRAMFQDRYRFQDLNDQPFHMELGGGVALGGRSTTTGVTAHRPGGEVSARFDLVNGIPTDGWTFRRPFDHYDLRATLVIDADSASQKALGNFTIRGLLLGDGYGGGASRGLWGMFGAYDYLTPGTFRVSSSNVTLGTVGQADLGRGMTLQATAYAGIGFGAGGSAAEVEGRRDYHFGLQGVSLAEAKLFFAERFRLSVTGRGYYISGKVSPETDSYEWIAYTTTQLTARVAGPHAVAVGWTGARRRAQYPDIPDIHSRASNWELTYLFAPDGGLGIAR